MKELHKLALLLAMCLAFTACFTGEEEYIDPDYDDGAQPMVEDTTSGLPPVMPPVTEERLEIEKDAASKSPFLALGCCTDIEKRLDNCCCDEVVKEYKKMKADGDKKLGEYKMTDPILGKCIQQKPKVFDAIDSPPMENPDDDW